MEKENTKVELDIRPQIKGALPAVKLKPSEAQTATAELVTHLILERYHTLQKQFAELKAGFLTLPLVSKILGLTKTASAARTKYLNKEILAAKLSQLKNKALSQLKSKAQYIDQTKLLMEKFNRKYALTAKFTDLANKLRKNIFQTKLAEIKEDLREIRQQSQNILQTTLQHQLNKDSKPTA